MRSFLVNKNLSFDYWLKRRIWEKGALIITNTITIEKVILVFGREQVGSRIC
jgi:hypothetical protein